MSQNTERTIRIALAGNPNAGKTSMFNALTGSHHKVGNYPGVTVEKREGSLEYRGTKFHLIDLPGIYSLTAYSLDEVVTRDFVLDEKPDIVVDVLDSTNLERNLYLCLQFQELGIPVVAALNMSDEAEQNGLLIDANMLSRTLGIPMIKTVGTEGKGKEALLDAVLEAVEAGSSGKMPNYGTEIEAKLALLEAGLKSDAVFSDKYPPRWMAIKLIENDEHAIATLSQHGSGAKLKAQAEEYRAWLSKHFGKDAEIIITEQRYGYIRGALKEAVKKIPRFKASVTESIDKVLMNEFLGLPVFFLIIWGIFKLTFAVGEFPVQLLERFFAGLSSLLMAALPAGFFRSLLVDGIIAGVGGVFSFVPLIVMLFLSLSILEDTGYMSRAAFLTDKFLHAFGLHGQSFMPLMLGFGCTVPAIMATRTLKSPRDRIATILAVPFMSCGAKLPVYVLLAGAFFTKNPGNVVMAIYLAGVILSMVSTVFLRKTVLKGQTTPFVMELPPYRMPTVRGIFWHVWDKTWQYVKKAGTVILAASVLIWVITTFPQVGNESELASRFADEARIEAPAAAQEQLDGIVAARLSEYRLEHSIAGSIGKFLTPVIQPLGFNWKIGVALIPGFTAKELVVSTLGILYGAQIDAGDGVSLQDALRNDPRMNPLVALTLMVFILVMPPCFASLATIRAEAGNRWMLFQVGYSLTLAWILAFLVRAAGGLLTGM